MTVPVPESIRAIAIDAHLATFNNGAVHGCFCRAGGDHGELDEEVRELRAVVAQVQADAKAEALEEAIAAHESGRLSGTWWMRLKATEYREKGENSHE